MICTYLNVLRSRSSCADLWKIYFLTTRRWSLLTILNKHGSHHVYIVMNFTKWSVTNLKNELWQKSVCFSKLNVPTWPLLSVCLLVTWLLIVTFEKCASLPVLCRHSYTLFARTHFHMRTSTLTHTHKFIYLGYFLFLFLKTGFHFWRIVLEDYCAEYHCSEGETADVCFFTFCLPVSYWVIRTTKLCLIALLVYCYVGFADCSAHVCHLQVQCTSIIFIDWNL